MVTSFTQSPLYSTAFITAIMVLGCCLPWLTKLFATHAKSFFLFGIGAMFGICFFDLLPEIFEMGGVKSLVIMAVVWAAYSGIHIFQFGKHAHHSDTREAHEHHGFPLFMASMVAHCFSSGALLVVSQDLSQAIAKSVFYALIIHKLLEAFSVSAVITEHRTSKPRKTLAFAFYLLSVPAGALATLFFSTMITSKIALVLSDIAAGTLAGCLLFDFLIPNLKEKSSRKQKLSWMLAGLVVMLFTLQRI